jgi:hypothetical protein
MNGKKSKSEKKESSDFVKLYVPELMQLVESGDEKMCLIMAQVEYWFARKPDGFYKFMSPAKGDNPAYQAGDSWTEEMGMSDTKIANALKPICTSYKSFTAYKNEAGDKFKGKFYCSYYHKPSHQTFYLRNHDLVNAALKRLSLEKRSNIFREKNSSKAGNDEKIFSGNIETNFPEILEAEVVYTENTTKNNQENNAYSTQEREENSHFFPDTIKNEKEENKNVMQEEGEEVFRPSADNVAYHSTGISVVNGKDAWQTPQQIAVPFPADFELTEEMIAWAETKKPGIDVQNSTDIFKIKHGGNYRKDWFNEWQLWIMRERAVKGTGYTSGKLSQADIFRESMGMFEGYTDEPEQVVNKPEPGNSKIISPTFRKIEIPNPHSWAILKVSYQIEPYLMHRDLLHSAYKAFCSTGKLEYSQQSFDDGLNYLCRCKIFQSYFGDYFINRIEYRESPDWKNLTWEEISKIEIESGNEIIDFITEKVLVLDDEVAKKFSSIDVKELELFINGKIISKLLASKNHYIYNLKQYNSNADFKEEVDKKLKESGLSVNNQ